MFWKVLEYYENCELKSNSEVKNELGTEPSTLRFGNVLQRFVSKTMLYYSFSSTALQPGVAFGVPHRVS
jgi:hypothetical protein